MSSTVLLPRPFFPSNFPSLVIYCRQFLCNICHNQDFSIFLQSFHSHISNLSKYLSLPMLHTILKYKRFNKFLSWINLCMSYFYIWMENQTNMRLVNLVVESSAWMCAVLSISLLGLIVACALCFIYERHLFSYFQGKKPDVHRM